LGGTVVTGDRAYRISGVDTPKRRAESSDVDAETGEALGRLERDLREEIQASTARTRESIVESEGRTRELIAESEGRTRRHFDVVAESLRGDIRALAEGVMAVAEGSMRRDTELGGRVDRLEHRTLGLESRVSVLERPRPRRRRRR